MALRHVATLTARSHRKGRLAESEYRRAVEVEEKSLLDVRIAAIEQPTGLSWAEHCAITCICSSLPFCHFRGLWFIIPDYTLIFQ
jgi:hypothetical protein